MFSNNHPIGIDIHGQGVCALQLHKTRKGTRVRTIARLPLEIEGTGTAEEIGALAPTLKKLKGKFAFRGKSVVVCLPPEYVASFPVTFEVDPRQSLESALLQACRRHLSFPIEEAVIDYLYVQATDGSSERQRRASIVAVPQSRIAQILQVFWQAGWRVDVIDFNLSALLRLHGLAHRLDDIPSVLIHIGTEATLLAVATQREIVAHRHLDWGVGRLQRRLAENMQIDSDGHSTLNLLQAYGLAYAVMQAKSPATRSGETAADTMDRTAPRVVSQILVPYLEDLVHEIYQLIGYTRSISPGIDFKEICLYGMANEIKGLATYLQNRLQIETRGIDPFMRLSLADGADSMPPAVMHPFVYALGLALREVR